MRGFASLPHFARMRFRVKKIMVAICVREVTAQFVPALALMRVQRTENHYLGDREEAPDASLLHEVARNHCGHERAKDEKKNSLTSVAVGAQVTSDTNEE